MKTAVILLFLAFQPFLLIADWKWKEFGLSEGSKKVFKIGKTRITIQTRDADAGDFKEDHLILTARIARGRSIQQWFDSSYGTGAVALYDNLLLLKYGIGRGTCARDEHIKVYRLTRDSMEEVCDVQTSYYVDSLKPNITSPDRIDYRMKAEKKRDYTVFTFWTVQPRRGILSDKKVMVKNVR